MVLLLQAYAISAIARWDWPENWPDLFDQLIPALSSGEPNLVHGTMRVLSGACVWRVGKGGMDKCPCVASFLASHTFIAYGMLFLAMCVFSWRSVAPTSVPLRDAIEKSCLQKVLYTCVSLSFPAL